MIVKAFNGEMVDVGDCMGCVKATGKVNVGEILKTKNFDISQDFELPINGFIVIGSLRHIETISEMTKEEKQELIVIIDETIRALKNIGVCSEYDVVWEEKEGNHFHAWLMPRHKYLLDAMGTNIIKKVGELFDYAKTNLRTEENLNEIAKTIKNLKTELLKSPTINSVMGE